MLTVTNILVRSFNLDQIDIFWEISPVAGPGQEESTPHEIYDYDFYILRSDAANGPYHSLGGPFRDTYLFRDTQTSLLHKWRQFYYKIRIVHRPTGEEKLFGPAFSNMAEPDRIAANIIRMEDVLFREFIGRRCWLYPVRTFGPRCSCFNVYTARKTVANHLPCFGTGWLGGYMSPVECWVQVDPSPVDNELNSLQERQIGNTRARMISFPPVSPRDILIESENRRWRVVSVTTTERLRSVVHQELLLHEIPKGDVEYSLPINVDPFTNHPAAERNYTNPQNIENDGEYSDIIAMFGHPRGSV